MKNKSVITLGIAASSMSALLYGFLPVFTNLAYACGINTETYNVLKSVLALPFLLVIIFLCKDSLYLPRRILFLTLFAGALGKGLTSFLLFSSYKYLNGGVATTLHFTYPLFVALAGAVFFKKKLPIYKWITILIATVTTSLFIDPSGNRGSAVGVIYALSSAIVYSVYIVLVDNFGISEVKPFVFSFYLSSAGALYSLIYGVITGTLDFSVPAGAYVWSGAAAVATCVIAATLFQQGIKLLGGTNASFFSMLEPVGSCIFGVLFIHEVLTGRSVIGVMLILAAEIVMIYLDNKHAKAN